MCYLTCVCALTLLTLHENLAQVKPDPPSMGAGVKHVGCHFYFQYRFSSNSLLVKHRIAMQERPVVTCVFVLLSVLFSSTGTDSSDLLTSLGVDTASIE